jgi:hypothetical protein|nr:MAG TPA: hypothetical protein [Caudoviricetes sp.]
MKVSIETNLPISDIALKNLEKFFIKYFNKENVNEKDTKRQTERYLLDGTCC